MGVTVCYGGRVVQYTMKDVCGQIETIVDLNFILR